MSERALYLFDDHHARRWAPFTLTRPAGELAYGAWLLRERSERVLGLTCRGHLTRPALAGFKEPDSPPVIPATDVPLDAARVLLSSRAVLTRLREELPEGPARLAVHGMTVGWVLSPGDPMPTDHHLRFPARHDAEPGIELEGEVLMHPWQLIGGTEGQLAEDLRVLAAKDATPSGVARVGENPLDLCPGAEVEPGVVVDTRQGPVRLEDRVRIEGPARLVGPLLIRRGSTILGGRVGTSYIGPSCRVHGEVSESILLGYDNKAHEGHLGHAILGRWVNLGAMTTNSDLKNNYATVRMWTMDGQRDTGLVKVGCFFGDHVKTGIGTLINTGTVVGAGSNIFGGLTPPPVVPPFSWGSGTDLRDYRLDKFLEAVERSMVRRDLGLTPGMRTLLSRAWTETRVRRAV